MILLIDNYDSFSYNLYQLIGAIEPDIKVARSDELTAAEIEALAPDKIILSPGPGRPEDVGNIVKVVKALGDRIPILGVRLGHQAICAAFGATVTYARQLMHGKQSQVTLDSDCPLFRGCSTPTQMGRYHSLAADPGTLSDCLAVTARTEDGEVMAVSAPVIKCKKTPREKCRKVAERRKKRSTTSSPTAGRPRCRMS